MHLWRSEYIQHGSCQGQCIGCNDFLLVLRALRHPVTEGLRSELSLQSHLLSARVMTNHDE